ncbi:MAG: hypothetical protein ACI3Y5_02930 [Prevotella sp.]
MNAIYSSSKHAMCYKGLNDIICEDIVVSTTTAIEGTETNTAATPAAGQRRATMQKGVNIVRMSDGTTRKVMMK